MIFFRRKNRDIPEHLEGDTDWHCHVLPGVDDGIESFEESVEALRHYEMAGVRDVWFTPHIMEDIPNTTQGLQQRLHELKQRYDGPLQLHLAAEYMLDSLFEQRLAQRDILTLGNGHDLLVETSYFNAPMNLYDVMARITEAGYHPVLAHPERYIYMGTDDYARLRQLGIGMQLNVTSTAGAYGKEARDKARWLLTRGFYTHRGTDAHRAFSLEMAFGL